MVTTSKARAGVWLGLGAILCALLVAGTSCERTSEQPRPATTPLQASGTHESQNAAVPFREPLPSTPAQGLHQRILLAGLQEAAWHYVRVTDAVPASPTVLFVQGLIPFVPAEASGEAAALIREGAAAESSDDRAFMIWFPMSNGWAWNSYAPAIDSAPRSNPVVEFQSLADRKTRLAEKGRWPPLEDPILLKAKLPPDTPYMPGRGYFWDSPDVREHQLLVLHHVLRLLIWHAYRAHNEITSDLPTLARETGLAPWRSTFCDVSDLTPGVPGILVEADHARRAIRLTLFSDAPTAFVSEYRINPLETNGTSDWSLDPMPAEDRTTLGTSGSYVPIGAIRLVDTE